MSNQYLSRFHNEPALIAPEYSERFKANLEGLAEAATELPMDQASIEMSDDFWGQEGVSRIRPYIVREGILQIPVQGVLLNNFPFQFGSWATGYEYIQKAFDRGMDDSDVKGIALIIDSPGGMVAGNFDLVDKMFARRGEKPVRAYAAESAYSAAYSIASVADNITVTRSGGVGSIGVVTMHIDISKMLNDVGYKITFIHAGKHKVDGNPYEALPADVKERIQGRIDALYSDFVAIVARNREMDEQAIRDTEALTYPASEAVSIGLADSIGPLDDALTEFSVELSNQQEEIVMSKQQDNNAAVDQAAIDTARAEGVAEGTKAGVTAERTRISEIMGLDEAENRQASALHIALTTDLTPDAAKGLLATIPEAKKEEAAPAAAEQTDSFDAAMAQGNPELGAEGGEQKVSRSKEILGNYAAETGFKRKQA